MTTCIILHDTAEAPAPASSLPAGRRHGGSQQEPVRQGCFLSGMGRGAGEGEGPHVGMHCSMAYVDASSSGKTLATVSWRGTPLRRRPPAAARCAAEPLSASWPTAWHRGSRQAGVLRLRPGGAWNGAWRSARTHGQEKVEHVLGL